MSKKKLFQLILPAAVTCLLPICTAAAQQAPERSKIALGQKTELRGVIVERGESEFVVRDQSDREMLVKFGAATEVKEKRRNFLRSGTAYTEADLIPGLNVVVKGVGDVDGNLIAQRVSFTQDDLKVAQTIWSRVHPVDKRLTQTEGELALTQDEVRRNQANNEGRIEELDAAFQLSRGEAREARESADNAQATADEAIEGVAAADARITALDDFSEVKKVDVLFDLNSSELDANARLLLDGFTEVAAGERAYLFEVTGYSSSDGNPDYNRLLSEQRAEQVVKYLVDQHQVPLRRILSAFGHGENLPASDNKTFEGRQQNRRVQVRFLVSKALAGAATNGHS